MMGLFLIRKYRKLTDEDLISAFQEQQKNEALQVIYERYAHLVFGVCLKYMKNTHNAEDITSKVFESLNQKILRSEIRYFKSWLHSVVRNECLMQLRKKTPHFESDGLELLREEEESEDKTSQEIQLTAMQSCLEELKEDQRKCLEAFYLKEQSYQEISDQLNMDLKKVKSNIQNGKRNLKIKLENNHEFKRAI